MVSPNSIAIIAKRAMMIAKRKVGGRMYKQCYTEQSAHRQRELELGLLRLMKRKSFSEITVTELCTELNIPRKAFYRYFGSKEGALYALLDHSIMDIESRYLMLFDGETMDDPKKNVENLLRSWKEKRELIDALGRNRLMSVLIERAVLYAMDLDVFPVFMLGADSESVKYGRTFVSSGMMAMLYQWHCEHYATSVEDMARLALRLFREPLFQPK